MKKPQHTLDIWFSRIAVLFVFIWNIQCAFVFIFTPERYISAYELTGVGGIAAIQGMGVAFLMWNVTYPLVILAPKKHFLLFKIVLIQQLVGLLGESYILLTTASTHLPLKSSLLKFILFDAAGFLLMLIGYIWIAKRIKLGYDGGSV